MKLRPLVGIAIAAALLPAPWAHAAPKPAKSEPAAAKESRGRAHVAVDTSEIGEAGPAIRRRVNERADVVLRRAGIMPGRGPQDPTINVVVRERTGDKPGWEYVITVTNSDAPVPQTEPAVCDLCTETELVDAIEGRLATIAAELEALAREAEAQGDETATSDTDPTVDPGPLPVDDKRLGNKGKAGAALVAVGGIGVVVGIVLAVLPAKPCGSCGDKTDKPFWEKTTRIPGIAVLSAGAATVVIGAVLLGLDRRAARRRSSAHARIQALPSAGLGFRF